MKIKARFLLHVDERHFGGREWWHSITEHPSQDNNRNQGREIIGVAVTKAQNTPDMVYSEDEFHQDVEQKAVDVRWFDDPLPLSQAGSKAPISHRM